MSLLDFFFHQWYYLFCASNFLWLISWFSLELVCSGSLGWATHCIRELSDLKQIKLIISTHRTASNRIKHTRVYPNLPATQSWHFCKNYNSIRLRQRLSAALILIVVHSILDNTYGSKLHISLVCMHIQQVGDILYGSIHTLQKCQIWQICLYCHLRVITEKLDGMLHTTRSGEGGRSTAANWG